MDKNTLTGFLLIGLILVGFYFVSKPSQEQIEYQRKMAEQAQAAQAEQVLETQDTLALEVEDSTAMAARLGVFSAAGEGQERIDTLETDLLRIAFSNKGGVISSVELKEYKDGYLRPLLLFDGKEENLYSLIFSTSNARVLNTADLYFEQLPIQKNDTAQIVTYRLNAGEASYMDFVYTVPNDNYMLRFDVRTVGMHDVFSSNMTAFELQWNGKVRQQEKGRDFESRYSGLYFKYLADDVDNLSESGAETKEVPTKLKWVSFKDQFFSTILIADESFSSAKLQTEAYKSGQYLKSCSADMYVPYDGNGAGFRFYFGPNHFKTLNSYDKHLKKDEKLDLQRLIPLGWTIFRWVNRWLVIPMFNWFGSFISNMGIIILLMTIVIKILIFPLTYKSYMSTAKMRVLKPEIEKINEKYPADKMQERQRATMELYSRAGVNPMGGCLPMLLQMPVLIALFSFFPSAIELRQQSFLWADDLSTYDSIYDLPFNIPFYGDHISLFCLLMTITNIIYTKWNMEASNTGGQQMPGMKLMMYLMPIMFLFFFNSYASGLSYYYFISLLITIIQTYAIKASVNEEALLKQLNENKKKPQKKSGFMARLEKMQKEQLEAQRKAAKRR
jgi:YidC/Oxa1 family membrane protein insertase